jgi:hypothetical protein
MPSAVPRARGASPAAPAPSNCAAGHARDEQLRWARTREPTQWPHAGDRYRATHCALPARLLSYADFILKNFKTPNPRASRLMLRLLLVALPLVVASPAAFDAQEIDALQIEVQAPLQIEVRSPPESRPLRPAATREQHDSFALHSTPHARHPHMSQWTRRGTRMRARRSTLRSTSSPTSSQPRDTNPPSTGAPPSPAGYHTCGAASVGPAAVRARLLRMMHVHSHEAARARAMSAPAPARLRRLLARRGAMQLALAIGTCERARRLACFADGLRVASPVQAAAAACGRARRPSRPRHLRHDRQAQRRHHGHKMIRPHGPVYAKPSVPVKPMPVSRAWTSSRLRPRRRTARPAHHRVRRRRLRPGHRRLDHHSKHHRRLVGA